MNRIKTLICAALLTAGAANAAVLNERCMSLAAMYQMAYSLRDTGLTERQTLDYLRAFPDFTDRQMLEAIHRTAISGDLGYMSMKILHKAVYLSCTANR